MFSLYQLDVAAMLVSLILIAFYFQKHQIGSLQNKSFLVYLCCIFIIAALEICISEIMRYAPGFPLPILWIMQSVYLTLAKALGMIFAVYCVGYTGVLYDNNYKYVKLLNGLLAIPFLFAIVIIWVSPFLVNIYPLVFIVDELGRPVKNIDSIWYNVLFAIGGLYVIFSIIFIFLHRNRVQLEKRIVLYICAVLAFIAVLIQLVVPSAAIECFVLSMAGLVFFFYIQNPEEVIDNVTKSFNQLAFVSITTRYFTKQVPFTCVSILIDDTIFLSRTFGINQMNKFLQEVAKFLWETFSYGSSFCINQNCFTVVIKNPDDKTVRQVVDKIRTRFKMNWYYDSVELKLYIRECVVECPRCAKNPDEVLDIFNLVASDERYKQPVVYASEIDLEFKHRNDYIEYALKNGISQNRFDVYYQPIFSTADKKIIGAEALIRLRDEQGRFLSPEDFIPIAEKSGTILRIGEYVYESVCRTISQINLREYGIKKIDINLSVAQCMQEILAEQILSIQSIYQIPACIINLEITETAAAHSPDILLRNMERLAAAGFELSLDDYGSGYSNMNYMLNLPFKMVKIDKYIVWSAFNDERAKKALTATIQMIKSLDMTVLAEGVEDRAQAEMLASLGCDYLQGYYFSRPVKKDEFLALMKSQQQNPPNLI